MFLSRIKADSGGDRSPWGSFWFEPVGMRSSTGLRVTSGSAMRLSAVYSCVRVLSETFAVLPLRLYKKRADGGRDEVRDHWLYRLLAKAPNVWQTPFEWREMMMGHLALRGNAFNEIVANGKGEITQLIPIHPDRIQARLRVDGNYDYVVRQLDGSDVVYARGRIWHLRGLSSDGILGLNPIEVAADVFGLGIAAQSYGSRFFANDTKPGGWLEMTGKFADDAARQQFKESWAQAQGGLSRGKTAVLESGMKYHELSLNNSDAQFLESRKFSRSEIASVFRVPPHKIGDLDKATFSNIEQQSLEFVNDTMTPWAERWESSIETFLMLDGDDLEVEFDFANLLRGDSAARAVFLKAGINDGWMTRNEARISEGLNPIDGLDAPLRPLNMVENGAPDVQKPAVIPPAADMADNSAGACTQDSPAALARFTALVRGNAERMARRMTAGEPPKAAVLALALAIPLADAEQFLAAAANEQRPAALVTEDLIKLALKGTS
jgi:HK97 family phage portal protein